MKIIFKISFFSLCVLCALRGEIFSQWDEYPTYQDYVNMMYQFENDYPEKCRIKRIGYTLQNREFLFAVISDNVNTDEPEPRVMYTSSMHGDETLGYVTMLRLIDYLLSSYDTSSQVKNLVDNSEIWIMPLENPDATYAGGDSTITGAIGGKVDLNRNYPNPVQGQNPGGAWQKCTIAMMELTDSVKFVLSANFHGGAELIAYPFHSWRPVTKTHADEAWFIYVLRNFVDIIHDNSPSSSNYMEDMHNGITQGGEWYIAYGTRVDYMTWYKHCREVQAEISAIKLMSPSNLPTYWEYLYRSLLYYIEQCLYGINGIVTDSITGNPLPAKVWVENHDRDSSHVYCNMPFGDYYRPIYQGTYDVTFSCNGYYSKTITGVEVKNNEATILNVKLRKIQTGIIPEIKNLKDLSIINWERVKKIEIYNLTGKMVKTLPATAKINWQEGNGIYIVRLIGKNIKKQFKVMFTK